LGMGFLVATLLLARAQTASAQGLLIIVDLEVSGTLGDNGWYVSDVTVSWPTLPADVVIDSGCGTTVTNFDTAGTVVICQAHDPVNQDQYAGAVEIKRDTTPPVAVINAPTTEPLVLLEGTTYMLDASQSYDNLSSVVATFDIDGDGVFGDTSVIVADDDPLPTGHVNPCMLVALDLIAALGG